jgi:hypothetical protein
MMVTSRPCGVRRFVARAFVVVASSLAFVASTDARAAAPVPVIAFLISAGGYS